MRYEIHVPPYLWIHYRKWKTTQNLFQKEILHHDPPICAYASTENKDNEVKNAFYVKLEKEDSQIVPRNFNTKVGR